MHFDEQEYIDGLKSGDKKIFKKIFYTYYSPLSSFAARYVGEDRAEELVQDFMVNLWSKRESLLISTSLKSYLFTAIRNRALNMLRNEEREQNLYELLANEDFDVDNNPFDKYIYRELTDRVNKAIEELPENYKEVFKLSRLTSMSNKEIADSLGISIKTVEYKITQSLKILRVELRDYLACLLWLITLNL